MSRLRSFALVLVVPLLLVFAPLSPALAQDTASTPEATPSIVTITVPNTTVNVEQPTSADTTPSDAAQWFDLSKAAPYIAVILILAVLLVLEVADRRKLATLAANSMTPEVFSVVSAAINKTLTDAGVFVAASPTPIDDAMFAPTRVAIDDLLARIKALEDAKSSAQVTVNNNPSAPDSGSNSS